ncbi:hypothetical protein C8J56DRAFT_883295 [Mycena floridula]|nr:hypothetical protein C8J56DRAFT_883295 [Mycena floridula]
MVMFNCDNALTCTITCWEHHAILPPLKFSTRKGAKVLKEDKERLQQSPETRSTAKYADLGASVLFLELSLIKSFTPSAKFVAAPTITPDLLKFLACLPSISMLVVISTETHDDEGDSLKYNPLKFERQNHLGRDITSWDGRKITWSSQHSVGSASLTPGYRHQNLCDAPLVVKSVGNPKAGSALAVYATAPTSDSQEWKGGHYTYLLSRLPPDVQKRLNREFDDFLADHSTGTPLNM